MTPKHLKRWTLPRDYMGAHWDGYFGSGFSQNRDSDALERSNFTTMRKAMEALPPWEGDEESRVVVSENHWAVGWVEWFAIHDTDDAALALADSLQERMAIYPVLDEDHYSNLEWTEACDYWARMSLADRLAAIDRAGAGVSMFAVRRDELPQDDDGRLFEYLRS